MKKNYNLLKQLTLIFGLGAVGVNAQTTYCSSQASSMYDEEIYNVMINGANTNSMYSFVNGCTNVAPGPGSILHQYANHKNAGALTSLVAGTATSFSVAQDECDGATYYYNGCGVWIDWNQNGVFTDPGETIYTDPSTFQGPRSITGTISVPGTAMTGSTVMRVIVAEGYSGGSLSPCLSYGYGETEDYRIDVFPAVPCSGSVTPNSVAGPTAVICPNSTAALGLASNYTVVGLTYQWQASTLSSVGPFTSIPGATSTAFSAPNVTVNTWYTAVITCTNSSSTYTTAAMSVSVSPVTINTVPYYESFEGIAGPNKLPNCSWSANNIPTTCQTYVSSNTNGRIARTGSSFASFYYSPASTNYFYTNGIQLNAGVTYSASVWYTTEYYGYNNWTDLSIMYGTTQSPTGLVTIASSNGPAISNVYKSLSNTFTVATSGIYYVAIKAVGTTGAYAYYLSWDDLEIIIPCDENSPNTPALNLVASTTSICAGETVNLNISGADTYTWNTGSNASGLSETPQNNQLYTVVGTNTLTGCTNTVSQMVMVSNPPSLVVIANPISVCSGASAVIQAIGGTTYTWSTGGNGQNITVNPTAPTSYTALSMGANGCVGSAAIAINVYSLPNVTASTDRPNEMCPTEIAVLTAVGSGVTYSWFSNTSSALLMGNPINVSPNATSIYTVTATDVNGCKNSSTIVQNVIDCTSLTERTILSNLNVFPNPTSGEFSIETTNTLTKSIEVIDITGKVVYSTASNLDVVKFNLKDIANGVYYVKIQSNNSVEVVKVVKQ
jgi:hypothetical protein